MDSQVIETLVAQIRADNVQYIGTMQQAITQNQHLERSVMQVKHGTESMFAELADKAKELGTIVAGSFGIGFGVERLLGGSIERLKEEAEAIVHLKHASEQLDLPINDLAAMEYQAKLSHVELESMNTTMIRLQRSMVEAAMGEERAAKGYELMHLNAKDLIQLPFSQALDQITDRL